MDVLPDLSAGACRNVPDPDVFFPEDGDEVGAARAKRICAGCPVRSACLAYALATDEPHGIAGGLDPEERGTLARRTTATRTPVGTSVTAVLSQVDEALRRVREHAANRSRTAAQQPPAPAAQHAAGPVVTEVPTGGGQ
ncbi:WhiB family transcriptional regulator [Kitasatospora indigofera]|uniref:WhiB family transcriptional regulator n=1 Tax=Kitasatospora indigofera TaxID=67307 RepID=UPI00227D8439|nr:WhiB family transcriptional regulator [Kitasatospora indigofera]